MILILASVKLGSCRFAIIGVLTGLLFIIPYHSRIASTYHSYDIDRVLTFNLISDLSIFIYRIQLTSSRSFISKYLFRSSLTTLI